MNPWLYTYVISLILFFLIADWRKVSINLYGGLLSAVYMLIDTFLANRLELFKYHNVGLNMPESILFSASVNIFSIGLAFNIGFIFSQLLPQKLGLQFIYSLIWTLFHLLFKLILKEFDLVSFIHFRVYFILRFLMFFLTIAWFKTFFLGQKKSLYYEE